jgi:hypothetical protein
MHFPTALALYLYIVPLVFCSYYMCMPVELWHTNNLAMK